MNNISRILLSIILCTVPTIISAQGINGYAAVTAVSGSTITVNSVDETDDTFEDGEFIIIMQMQDNVIGNTTNTASFGILGTIQSAGLYEVRQILSHTETTGVPATITLTQSPSNTYNINANATVQIISFPSLGSPDYTTVANMSPPSWNGTIGGVLAFDVTGALTLAHDISADNDGFRGGGADITSTNGSCEDNIFISTNTVRAFKGEGIYKNNNSAYEAAKGKILTGGGGGNSHNAGGGGGGNFESGGEGGVGWGCRNSTTGQSAGGQGGISLSANISSNRLFLGGGGGAGERNNAHITTGGNGGGIILIKANEIRTLGACAGLSISANGQTTPNIGNDGAGGAGAGGSIFLDVGTFNIVAGCSVSVESNGGDGGSAITGSVHAGGGGGGQGVVIYSIIEPTTNISTTTTSGTGGCANNSNPCISVAGSGGGSTGDGIVESSPSGPLPIALTYFKAEKIENNEVLLNWETKSETNNDYFTIEKSVDGFDWTFLSKVAGAGNSSNTNHYQIIDQTPRFGVNYYRLVQVDYDGTKTIEGVESVFIENYGSSVFTAYPNPSTGLIFINTDGSDLVKTINIRNAIGQAIGLTTFWVNGTTQVDLSKLSKGIYFLQIQGEKGTSQTIKVVLK